MKGKNGMHVWVIAGPCHMRVLLPAGAYKCWGCVWMPGWARTQYLLMNVKWGGPCQGYSTHQKVTEPDLGDRFSRGNCGLAPMGLQHLLDYTDNWGGDALSQAGARN